MINMHSRLMVAQPWLNPLNLFEFMINLLLWRGY